MPKVRQTQFHPIQTTPLPCIPIHFQQRQRHNKIHGLSKFHSLRDNGRRRDGPNPGLPSHRLLLPLLAGPDLHPKRKFLQKHGRKDGIQPRLGARGQTRGVYAKDRPRRKCQKILFLIPNQTYQLGLFQRNAFCAPSNRTA